MNPKLLGLHRDGFLCDLHCDTLMSFPTPEEILYGRAKGQTDLPRFIEGGYVGVVMSMYVRPSEHNQEELSLNKMLEIFYQFLRIADGKVGLVTCYEDIIKNQAEGKFSVILGIEGLHPLGGSLTKIEEYFMKGVRVFTLTWNNPNEFADSCENSCNSKTDYGLTELGKQAVKLINELGGIIDLAHISKKAFFDVVELSETPPIVSHTGLTFARDFYRNINDDQIRVLGEKGGIIGIFFIPEYLNPNGKPKIYIKDIVKCYEHIANLAGIDAAAIGTDFDGTNNLPYGISGPEHLWKLTKGLLRHNFDELSVKKILGLNFLRILKLVGEHKKVR